MKALLLVFLGGGVGSAARYAIGKVLNSTQTDIPYGTLTVNILGSLCIGVFMGLSIKNSGISNNVLLLITTGFCGGFTTFSTFAYENLTLLKNGDTITFLLYVLVSLVMGLIAVFSGIGIAKLF